MWQRFTERARRVILLGQEEAGKLNAGHVGTEHLLLGMVREHEGVAAQVLIRFGITDVKVRTEIERHLLPSPNTVPGEPKLTAKAKHTLELAADEARRMRHDYIGTEHLLLALLREKDGLAATVLRELGLNLDVGRTQVLEYLGPDAPQQDTNQASQQALPIFTPEAIELLSLAAAESEAEGCGEVGVSHLLKALLRPEYRKLLD